MSKLTPALLLIGCSGLVPGAGSPHREAGDAAVALSGTPAANPAVKLAESKGRVAVLVAFGDAPKEVVATAVAERVLYEGWSGDEERGGLSLAAGEAVRIDGLARVVDAPTPLTLSRRVEVADARVHGALHAYGTSDEKAVVRALVLDPGARVERVGERPDGGCVYRVADGLVTLPCLPPEVAVGEAPAVRWRGSTARGRSGWIDLDTGFSPDPATSW